MNAQACGRLDIAGAIVTRLVWCRAVCRSNPMNCGGVSCVGMSRTTSASKHELRRRRHELGRRRGLNRHEQRGSELRRHVSHDKCQRTRGPRPSRRRVGDGCASRQEGTLVSLPENQQSTSTSRTHHRQVQVCRQLVGKPKADEPEVGRMPTAKKPVSAGFSKKTNPSPS